MSQATRMTRQRALILEELRAVTTHPTADEIYDKVRAKMPRISLGTVYRNLDLLSEGSEILKLEYAGFQKRFDGNTVPHQHVRCLRCGRVGDVHPEVETPSIPSNMDVPGFSIVSARVEFFGLCDACAGQG
ncbi:transcriptional repressor [Desulfovibrio sp. OttesenSCG-928-C14]|nr:transcriptional repressor [Desulfovibrio sp. OttesenSCG-928-C14]